MKPISPDPPARPHKIQTMLAPAAFAFLLVATAYGVLEAHSSTDTWIGLAGGRQIAEQISWSNIRETFPLTDTFSYTFEGQPWFNQNWMTHLSQWYLYEHISPNAVIYGTWLLGGLTFMLVAMAAYWKSGSATGALVTASIMAIGCRNFLTARPATTSFFCMAALWALLCTIEGQDRKTRWWPIAILLPLLVVWGHAHGSFLLAYAVLVMYVSHWTVIHYSAHKVNSLATLLIPLGILATIAVSGKPLLFLDHPRVLRWLPVLGYAGFWFAVRVVKPRLSAHPRQIAGVILVSLLGLILTVLTSPFGLGHLTHGDKVAGSPVYRNVTEWHPPFTHITTAFPSMAPFWVILGGTSLLLIGCVLLKTFNSPEPTDEPSGNRVLSISFFDWAMLLFGACMVFWARRFAPMFYIFAGPTICALIVMLLGSASASMRQRLKGTLATALLVAAAITGWATVQAARGQLVDKFEGGKERFNLLERVTRCDLIPDEAIRYLRDNDIKARLFLEWTQAGRVMFLAPDIDVFIDGRSQQVYSEQHYLTYLKIWDATTSADQIRAILDDARTDAVLLRPGRRSKHLLACMTSSPEWLWVLQGPRESPFGLFLRHDSELVRTLSKRIRDGHEVRSESPEALATLGLTIAATAPRSRDAASADIAWAVRCWRSAIEQAPHLAGWCQNVTKGYLDLGQPEQARQYLASLVERARDNKNNLISADRDKLLEQVQICQRIIASRGR